MGDADADCEAAACRAPVCVEVLPVLVPVVVHAVRNASPVTNWKAWIREMSMRNLVGNGESAG